MVTPQQILACRKCICSDVSFILYALPGDSTYQFCCGHAGAQPSEAHNAVTIRSFGVPSDKQAFFINPEYSVAYVLSHDFSPSTGCACKAVRQSTNQAQYINSVAQIIDNLKSTHGKTVISRLQAIASADQPIDVALRYFEKHPDTFRYFYYLPDAGVWFGASPELILQYSPNESIVKSVALAGTRSSTDYTSQWDTKNTDEHAYVLHHICETFKAEGLTPQVSQIETLTFANVQHMMHTIEAHGSCHIHKLTDKLAPTPAICGVPIADALNHIRQHEKHQRLFYGGEIIVTSSSLHACYLNLRCAHASFDSSTGHWIYNIFTGGGITQHSIPQVEWHETDIKSQSLLNSFNNIAQHY